MSKKTRKVDIYINSTRIRWVLKSTKLFTSSYMYEDTLVTQNGLSKSIYALFERISAEEGGHGLIFNSMQVNWVLHICDLNGRELKKVKGTSYSPEKLTGSILTIMNRV